MLMGFELLYQKNTLACVTKFQLNIYLCVMYATFKLPYDSLPAIRYYNYILMLLKTEYDI
jgi:hypothetical protein